MKYRLLLCAAVAALTTTALSGCEVEASDTAKRGADQATSESTSVRSTTTADTGASPAASESPTPSGPTVTLHCPVKEGPADFAIDRLKPDWSPVWEAQFEVDDLGMSACTVEFSPKGKLEPVSAAERALWAIADGPDEDTLVWAYEGCSEHDSPWYLKKFPLNVGQNADAAQTLALCPKHPNAAILRNRMAKNQAESDSWEPSENPGAGSSGDGHLCLPNERDGDGDGYCGE